MSNKFLLLASGITIRIFLAFSTFHPDLLAFKLGGKVVGSGQLLDLYKFSDPQIAILNYPPAIYWFHGIFNFIFSNIGLSFVNDFMAVNQAVLGNWLFNVALLLVKIPYLVFDILAGFLLMRLFHSEKEKVLSLALWVFNPVSLYATYMMGQFDIIPVFFTVSALFFAYQRRVNLAALMLGFGTAFKIYPLFLLIPLILSKSRLTDKVKLFLIGLSPYIISILPYLPSADFRSTALVASQTTKSLYAAIPVSGGNAILLFPFGLITLYIYLFYKGVDLSNLWKVNLVTLLIFFVSTHHHPQWILWLTPFLIIELVKTRFRYWMLTGMIFFSFLGSLFFFDPSLTVNIFFPLFPQLYNLPGVWEMLGIPVDTFMARSIMQTILTAAATYLAYLYALNKTDV